MPPSPRPRAFDIFLLTALALILYATNARFTFIDDEVTILSAAAAPITQTLQAFRSGIGLHEHPPLYDLLLHVWLYLTNGSFSTLRLPSIAFYIVGLWLLARAAEEIAGRPSGHSLLWLGVLWPFGFHYGRLATWYAFCFLLVAASTLALLRFERQPSISRWLLLILCAAALIYTNYLGWAILACLAFDYVANTSRQTRKKAVQLVVASAAILLLIDAPLWRAFLAELRNGPQFIHTPAVAFLVGAFSLYSTFVSESVAPWNWALGVPACLSIAAVLLLTLKSSPPKARRFLLYALALVALMTVLGIINTRRLLPVAAWLLLPVAITLGTLPRSRERSALTAALLIILLIGWYGIFSRDYYSAPRFIEPWQQVAAEAAASARSGALLIDNNESLLLYLTYATHPPGTPGGWQMLQTLSAPGILNSGEWAQTSITLPSKVFYVRGAPAIPDPDPAETWLDAHCHIESERFRLSDPASALKAKFMPELGELPWRIHTVDYSCPSGLRTPAAETSAP